MLEHLLKIILQKDILQKDILQNDILQNDILIKLYDYLASEIRSNLIKIAGINVNENAETPNPDDENDRIQKKYEELNSTYPFNGMIAMIKAFDPNFDIRSYIRTNKSAKDKLQTLNQLLIQINKTSTDKWVKEIDLLHKSISGKNQEEIIKRAEELGELKNAIFTFRSLLNKICLKHVDPTSPLLKLL